MDERYSQSSNSQPWCFTVVAAHGLRLMRPEKSWRPIVTVEVDKHHQHETVLGSDGQNPNLKESFTLHHAELGSQVDIKVWHRSQSKKKKKRKLVAMASHSLGELAKKYTLDPSEHPSGQHIPKLTYRSWGFQEIHVRLQCHASRCVSSRGRNQNGTFLTIRLRPPPAVIEALSDDGGYASDTSSSSSSGESDTLASPPSDAGDIPIPDPVPEHKMGLRRRVRGFCVDSEDEIFSASEPDEHKPSLEHNFDDDFDYRDEESCLDDTSAIPSPPEGVIRIPAGPWGRIFASILPQYTEKIEPPPPLHFMERVLSSFTMYREMKAANLESHYERVHARLQMEWTYVGGLLVALAAVDAAVFAISPDSIFTIGSYARSAVAASAISSGLGLACDSWFLLRYNWIDVKTFVDRARDVYGSYFFFCLSARTPALCMLFSAISLLAFLGLVAFEAWPLGVMISFFFIGFIMTMQFLIYGAHWCATKVAQGGRAGGRRVATVVRSMTG